VPLILMKLEANRPRDRVDVLALLEAGADSNAVLVYLTNEAPELVTRYMELLNSR